MVNASGDQLAGKIVLVTGAASGMGAACAELLRTRGATVIALDRDEAGLTALAQRADVSPELCDLTDVDSLGPLVAACVERYGRIDGLVNSAGIFQTGELLEITPAEFDRIFAVNVRGLFFIQQEVARAMAATGGGSIVNFSSTAARIPRPISSHYAASKAAVVSLTRSAAVALGGVGVRVNAICPGVIQTPMIEAVQRERAETFGTSAGSIADEWRSAHPMGRLGDPAEVAEVVAFLISDASSYVSGESIGINGGSDEVG